MAIRHRDRTENGECGQCLGFLFLLQYCISYSPGITPSENYTVKIDELHQNYTKITNIISGTVSMWIMTSAYVIYPNRSDRHHVNT